MIRPQMYDAILFLIIYSLLPGYWGIGMWNINILLRK